MTTIAVALVGGLLPSCIWLVFWLSEDRCAPEPKIRIILTFLAGMAAVGLVLPIEQQLALHAPAIQSWLALFLPHNVSEILGSSVVLAPGVVLILWAITEELFKLAAGAIFGLSSSAYDEPLDAIIYLTTAALGFAAAENALYLFTSLGSITGTQSLLTGDLRFVGATLLHILASATIGLSLAFFFYSSRIMRIVALLVGVILAILLHTLFNFFILWGGGAKALYVFLPIWLGIVVTLALTERIKNPKRDYC